MTVQDKKERAYLCKALIDILTNCPDDKAFLKRLIFAQELINDEMQQFTDEEYTDVIMKLNNTF